MNEMISAFDLVCLNEETEQQQQQPVVIEPLFDSPRALQQNNNALFSVNSVDSVTHTIR